MGIFSGVVADRLDRRIFLRFVILGGSLVAGLMSSLLLTGAAAVWHVIAIAAAAGCLKAFFGTISQAYTYDIVGPEHALNGLALMSVSHRIGALIGSLTAGLIISASSIGAQYLVIGVFYVLGVVVLLATREVGQSAAVVREPVFRILAGHLQLIRENRVILVLMFLAATTEVFGFTHSSLLPVFARDVLEVGEVGLGVMIATGQAGGLIGLLLLANLRGSGRKGLYMLATAGAFGLGLMAFSLAKHIVLFLFILAGVNACSASADTLYKALMQANVPNEQRGRAVGSWVLSIGTAPIGYLEVGGIAGALGAPKALLINGGILASVNLAMALGLPRTRRFS